MIEKFESFLKLRLRSNWEACDSGILVWRNSIGYILVFMGIPFVLFTVLTGFLIPQVHILGTIILWWMKPLFDRLILQVISVRFFRNGAGLKTIAKGLWKNIMTGIIGDLLWRRFSIYRAARMPVRILEGNKGKMVSMRIRNLKKGGLDFCALLTSLGIVIEIGLFMTFGVLVYSLAGDNLDFTLDMVSDYSSQVNLVVLIIYALTVLIVEPLYMCMGFGIYINSRVEVEGWDLELGFNSFINNKKPDPMKISTAAPAFLLPFIISMFLLFIPAPPEAAAEEWYRTSTQEAPMEVLEEVLSSKDFGDFNKTKSVRFKRFETGPGKSRFNFDDLNIKEVLGIILRALLVIIAAAGLGFGVYRLIKMRKSFVPNKTVSWNKGVIPDFAGQDDPATLISKAGTYYSRGETRKAWAACLSAALRLYADPGNIEFAQDDTELDCLSKIYKSALWGRESFKELVFNWINLAYAGIEPGSGQFESSLAFCKNLKAGISAAGVSHE